MATYILTVHELLERLAKDDGKFPTTPASEDLKDFEHRSGRTKPKRSDSVISWLSDQSTVEREVDYTAYHKKSH